MFPGYLQSFWFSEHLDTVEDITLDRAMLGSILRPNIAQWILDEMPGWPDETRNELRLLAAGWLRRYVD